MYNTLNQYMSWTYAYNECISPLAAQCKLEKYKAFKQQNNKCFPLNTLLENKTPEECFIGIKVKPQDKYITYYLYLLHTLNGWTYVLKYIGKTYHCNGSFLHFYNVEKAKRYKTWKPFVKRLLKDFGEQSYFVPIIQYEWQQEELV